MSFFKKLISREELSEEEIAEKARVKEEKRIQREVATQERKATSAAKREAEKKRIEKFFGPNPGLGKELNFTSHEASFRYIESMLSPDEVVLSTIIAEFDKTEKREIKGVLVATDKKLIFASVSLNKEYTETFEYKKMNGLSLTADGYSKKELKIDYGRSVRKFDDINIGKDLDKFQAKVREQITLHKSGNVTSTTSTSSAASIPDKYEQLEKLGKLKDQGILSEEEFQSEKVKILNNLQ